MDRNERARIVRAPLRAGPPPARRAARGPRWKSGALLRAEAKAKASRLKPLPQRRRRGPCRSGFSCDALEHRCRVPIAADAAPATRLWLCAQERAACCSSGPLQRRWTADDKARRGARRTRARSPRCRMHRRRTPADVHAPSAQEARKAVLWRCPSLWFLSPGQARERNRPAGMRDEHAGMRVGYRERKRDSRTTKGHHKSALTLPSPASGRGEAKRKSTFAKEPT